MRYRTRGAKSADVINCGDDYWPFYSTTRPVCSYYTYPWGRDTLHETCTDELHAGPPYRTGGPFDKSSFSTDQYTVKCKGVIANPSGYYDGGFLPRGAPVSYLGDKPSDFGDGINDYGAAGWNSYRPTKPRCSAGVATAELREIPLMLKKTAKDFADLYLASGSPSLKDAGGSWLNANFGWLPFINDLRDFYKLTSNLDKRLKQLKRDNGQWVKRGGTVSTQQEETILVDDHNVWGVYPGPRYSDPNKGSERVVRSYTQDIWFSGRFRYFIPETHPWIWKARAIATLYGFVPSPSLIWELTPWSWLSDWCCNAGDCLEMISSMLTEDLCAKYAYIMGTTRLRVDVHGQGVFSHGPVVTGSWYAQYERKVRYPATEFGFGLTRDNFTSRQWSILGALGLSKL